MVDLLQPVIKAETIVTANREAIKKTSSQNLFSQHNTEYKGLLGIKETHLIQTNTIKKMAMQFKRLQIHIDLIDKLV